MIAEELPLDASPAADPWRDMRATCVDAILVRVIDTARNVQFFIRIERTPANLERGAEIHDGITVFLPSVKGGLPTTEHNAIEAAANDAWNNKKEAA